jgi:hypothetical protein
MRSRERAGETDVIESFDGVRPKIGTDMYHTRSIGQESVTWSPLIVAETKIFNLDKCQEKTVCCMFSTFLPQISLEDYLFFFPSSLFPYNWGVQRPLMLPSCGNMWLVDPMTSQTLVPLLFFNSNNPYNIWNGLENIPMMRDQRQKM